MNVSIGAGAFHWTLTSIADAIRPLTDTLSRELSNDYGGPMENLWIDLELCPPLHADQKPWGFRLQKSVSPPRELKAFNMSKERNVGHYSVRPDFKALEDMPVDQVPCYLIRLLYSSTEILVEKKCTLKGFDAEKFRQDFAAVAERLGCPVEEPCND
jgi:hypothetical protein